MRMWLDLDPKEMKDVWILDCHRTLHAYFGALKKVAEEVRKSPEKYTQSKSWCLWSRHPLLYPYHPAYVFLHHAELVFEMYARKMSGHSTPVTNEDLRAAWMVWVCDNQSIGKYWARGGVEKTLDPNVVAEHEKMRLRLRHVPWQEIEQCRTMWRDIEALILKGER
jgi:hypothetical protein